MATSARILSILAALTQAPLPAAGAEDHAGRAVAEAGAGPAAADDEKATSAAHAAPTVVRRPGTVVAIEGDMVVVDLGDEPAVGVGSVLKVYRRFPGGRGSAAFRDGSPWFEVGSVTVDGIEGRVAVGRQTAGPPRALPSALDESGAPPDRLHIGDALRTTGAVAARPKDVRVAFSMADLFAAGQVVPTDSGATLLSKWLDGVSAFEGPVEVQIVVRVPGVIGSPDLERAASITKDEPLGPLPGQNAVPVEGLWDDPAEPIAVPPGKEVIVVQSGERGPRTWRYADAITLAEQQGQAVARAVRASLDLPQEAVLVTVLPRPASEPGPSVPGYDTGGDQVRILSTGIRMKGAEPPEKKRAPARKSTPKATTPDATLRS